MSAQELVKILQKKHLSIATAESLTAGLLANKIAEIPGVSKTLRGGIIAYQNEIKIEVLGVNEKIIKEHGAVSAETATEMAIGVANRLQSDVAISTTGVAGPKASEGKPVGTVFIGVWILGKTFGEQFHLSGTREQIRQATCGLAFEFARDKLLEV